MQEYQNRKPNDRDDHLEENQRIGKRIAQDNRNQNWNEQYRSGRDFHNNAQNNNPGQQHYGADPNSSYRNSNINYGDNREHREQYKWGENSYQNNQNNQNRNNQHQQHWPADRGQDNYRHEERVRDNQFNQNNRNQQNFNSGNNNFNPGNRYQNDRYQNNRHDNGERYDVNRYVDSDNQFYAGEEPRMFDDRKQFAAEDYRYGSGNRRWESPDHDNDYDADNDRINNRRRNNGPQDNRGFFGRIADQVREDWRTFTNPDDDRNQNNQNNQNRWNEPRNFNRGYESGPRWADEDDSRRRHNDRWNNRNFDEDNRR